MAARENQGLFIAVILLVLLSVVLAVTTFFVYSGSKEASDRADSLTEQLDKAQKDVQGYQGQAGVLKILMGVEGATFSELDTNQGLVGQASNQELVAETQRIRDTYQADMDRVSAEAEGVDRTYTLAINQTLNALADTANNALVLDNKIDETVLKMNTEIAAKDTQLSEMQTQLDSSRTDLKTEQSAHETTRSELTSSLNKVGNDLTTTQQALSASTAAVKETRENFQQMVADREAKIQVHKNEIAELTKTETDLADGQIVKVAPRLGKVTINLGTNDGLRLRQNFAVYDNAVSNFKTGEGKATIEVTKILGGGLAEGRITFDKMTDPILKHDWIVTPTWDPGQVRKIAIVGRVDLDGNGRSDMQRFISMVEQNGGKVVAYQDEVTGKVFGEIDESINFFVKASLPLTSGRDGYNRMNRERERFQLTEISIENLMERMGIKAESKMERFDNNLPTTEFEKRKPSTTIEKSSPFDG